MRRVACRLAAGDARMIGGLLALLCLGCAAGPQPLPPASDRWPGVRAGATTVILLVHDAGLSARSWGPPEAPGLADALARAGYDVRVLEVPDVPLAERRARVARALRDLSPARVFGVGHGLGGTALVQAAAGAPVAGLVLLGAPLAFGGESLVLRQQLAAPPPTWRTLSRGQHRALLTVGLPRRVGRALDRHALAPVRIALSDWAPRSRGPAPVLDAEVAAALDARPSIPTLVIASATDGLAPAWVADPQALGRSWPNLTRRFVGRAHGDPADFGHLDLLAHPWARGALDPLIEDWLAAR
jgi:hypothetical protein